jgi:hypothetical protein
MDETLFGGSNRIMEVQDKQDGSQSSETMAALAAQTAT